MNCSKLKSLKDLKLIVGICLMCLACFIIFYMPMATPPEKVVPALETQISVEPAAPPQEPQEPQEEPDILQDAQITPDAPTPAPPALGLLVLPLPPDNVIEIPVAVVVKPAKSAKPKRGRMFPRLNRCRCCWPR